MDRKHAAALRGIKLSALLKLSGFCAVDDPAMIITLADLQRLEISLDVLPDRLLIDEVHRSAGYRLAFSERNLSLVGREIFRSVEPEIMTEDVAVTLAVEIEICVVGEVDDSRSVRLGGKGEAKLIFLGPLIARNCLEGSRIAHFTILRIIKELYSTLMLTALPDLVLEAFRTAMKVVRAVVDRKGVFLAVELELAESDAVGISSRHLARAWTVAEIAFRLRISEHHVSQIAVLVRHHDRNDSRSDARKLYVCALLILESIKVNLLTALGLSPKFLHYVHICCVFVLKIGNIKIIIFLRDVKIKLCRDGGAEGGFGQ
jgi:hypothetical protein